MGKQMIKAEHISKEYRLGVIGLELDKHKSKERERLMALSNVSFEVDAGETLGIIGHNGAGKSTLLKLLARITSPTAGRIFLNGQVASMIEVGTGFHPELTGRENIYLNGAILGMGMREIKGKMEEIIDFSECRQFIDTPVKRYSTGMCLKLGFSVAVHLDAEIVIMDEVLAVGDVAFQNKCIQKIREIAASGRTILFVSHNMNTIHSLCSRCLVLDHGKLIYDGDVDSAIESYTSLYFPVGSAHNLENWCRPSYRGIGEMAHMTYIELLGSTVFEMGNVLRFLLRFRALRLLEQPFLRVGIWANGEAVAIGFVGLANVQEGANEVKICVDITRLLPGKYSLELLLVEMADNGRVVKQDVLKDVLTFEIILSRNRPVYQAYNRDWGYEEIPVFVEC